MGVGDGGGAPGEVGNVGGDGGDAGVAEETAFEVEADGLGAEGIGDARAEEAGAAARIKEPVVGADARASEGAEELHVLVFNGEDGVVKEGLLVEGEADGRCLEEGGVLEGCTKREEATKGRAEQQFSAIALHRGGLGPLINSTQMP